MSRPLLRSMMRQPRRQGQHRRVRRLEFRVDDCDADRARIREDIREIKAALLVMGAPLEGDIPPELSCAVISGCRGPVTLDVGGQTVALRTSAGTRGIVAASGASTLYATALVTARATARACLADRADRISLVPMGKEGESRTDEDELCALHIRNILEGRPGDAEAVRKTILAGGEVARFNDLNAPHSFPEDLAIALDVDRFDFAIQVVMEDGMLVARARRVPGGLE